MRLRYYGSARVLLCPFHNVPVASALLWSLFAACLLRHIGVGGAEEAQTGVLIAVHHDIQHIRILIVAALFGVFDAGSVNADRRYSGNELTVPCTTLLQTVDVYFPACNYVCSRRIGFRLVLLWSYWSLFFMSCALWSAIENDKIVRERRSKRRAMRILNTSFLLERKK